MPRPTIPELLDFEAQWTRRHDGTKDLAIRADLGLPPATFYLLLGRAIETGEALEYDPMLVRRLRRIRDERETARVARVSRTG